MFEILTKQYIIYLVAKRICENCLPVGISCLEEKNDLFFRIFLFASHIPETQRTLTIDGKKAFSTAISIAGCPVLRGEKKPEVMKEEVTKYLAYRTIEKILD